MISSSIIYATDEGLSIDRKAGWFVFNQSTLTYYWRA